jgi:lipopolysaccharide/colanic/teichoic acid biosynthesis glycosyltransferase
MLRRANLLLIDALLVAVATVLAVLLRENFDIGQEKIIALIPFAGISVVVATTVFFVGGVDRTLWQYSSFADYKQIIILTVLAVLVTMVFTFAVNRLDGVARTLPVLQGGLIVGALISARVAARYWLRRKTCQPAQGQVNRQPRETVLIAGVNAVSELFLQSVREFASHQIEVAGILAEDPLLPGRTIQRRPILGTIDELSDVLGRLEVHGVAVDRIIVATPADRLLPHARKTLLELEATSDIALQFLSERLGFDDPSQKQSPSEPERIRTLALNREPDHRFWTSKRIIDCFAAAMLLIVFAPVIALVGLAVAFDVGFPLIFWQQRPGLNGRPFRLVKFRTMGAPHDNLFRRVPDEQRLSAVGRFLRRTRLDELPQLYNVVIGDMSFVGPRPLLPRDQAPEYAARLSVRPGLTGWAQINGGRLVPARDKAILDIWYVDKASFMLDCKIVLRTVQMVLFGERLNIKAISQARRDLERVPGFGSLLWAEMAGPAE